MYCFGSMHTEFTSKQLILSHFPLRYPKWSLYLELYYLKQTKIYSYYRCKRLYWSQNTMCWLAICTIKLSLANSQVITKGMSSYITCPTRYDISRIYPLHAYPICPTLLHVENARLFLYSLISCLLWSSKY